MENKNLTIFDKFKSLLEEHKPNGLNENNIDEIIKIIKDENLKEDFSSKKYNRKLRKAVEAIINDENCKDLISLKIKIAFIDYCIENSNKDKAIEYIGKIIPSDDINNANLEYSKILKKDEKYIEAIDLLYNSSDQNKFEDKTEAIKIYLFCVQKEIENIIADTNNKFNNMKENMLKENKTENDIKKVKDGIEKNKKRKVFNILKKAAEYLNKIEGKFPEITKEKDENNRNIFLKFEDELKNDLNINYIDIPKELIIAFAKKGDELNLSFFINKDIEKLTNEENEEQINIINDFYNNDIKNIKNTATLIRYSLLILKNNNIDNEKIANVLTYFKEKIEESRANNSNDFNSREITRFCSRIARIVDLNKIEKHKNILEEIRKLSNYDKSIEETILEKMKKTDESLNDISDSPVDEIQQPL